MHFRTHVREGNRDKPGLNSRTEYADGMIEHDAVVGTILKALDDLGIANDTVFLYSTDNGPHMNSWPDGGMTPFRSEKNTNWEGAYRVPAMIRWPGKIKPGTISNEMIAHHDWLPTFAAIGGDADVNSKYAKGVKGAGLTYKVHFDGYNLVPYLTGQVEKSPRESFIYINDDQQVTAMRYDNWKVVFMEQRAPGTLRIWAEPFTHLRLPKLYNLRMDPYERADITSNTYYDWFMRRAYVLQASQAYVGQFLESFKEFPQRQKAATFNLDEIMETMKKPGGG
jgi:arylsulfatase A-like enzyme